MSEKNNTSDLQTQAIKEFELKDVQELLKQLKTSDNLKLTEEFFKKLDNDDNSLSETEKKLYDTLGNNSELIKFLNELIKGLNKQTIDGFTILDNNTTGFTTLDNNNISKDKQNIETLLKENNISSLDELLNNKNIRRKILKMEFNIFNCPIIEFGKENKFLAIILEDIINKENSEISELLKGFEYQNGKKIDKKSFLKNDNCKPIDLIKKLTDLKDENGKKITSSEIKQILNGVAIVKNNNVTQSLQKILNDKGINNKDILTLEINERKIFLLEKGYNKNQIAKIEDKIKKIKKTENAFNTEIQEIEKIRKSIDITNPFNEIDDEYFIKNPEDIKHITDEEKVLFLIIGHTELKDKNFSSIINISLQNNLKIATEFVNASGKKITFTELKHLYSSENNDSNLKYFLIISDRDAIKNLIIHNNLTKNSEVIQEIKEDSEEIYDKIVELIEILDSKNEIADNSLLEDFKDLLNENNLFTIDYINTEDFYKIDNYYIDKIDSDFFNLINKNPSFTEELFKYLPKTLNKILENPTYSKNLLESNLNIYNTIYSNTEKENSSLDYIKLVLKDDKEKNKESLISKVIFKDFKQAFAIFKLIQNKENYSINFNKIIANSNITSQILKFLNKENLLELKKLTVEEEKIYMEIKKTLGSYQKKIKSFKDIEEENKITTSLKQKNYTFESKDIFEKVKNVLNIEKTDTDKEMILGNTLSYVHMSIMGKDTTRLLQDFIALGVTEEEFKNILIKLNKIVESELTNILEENFTKKIEGKDKDILEKYGVLNNETINSEILKKKMISFLKENKTIKNENGEEISITSKEGKKLLFNKFIKKNKLEELTDETKNNFSLAFTLIYVDIYSKSITKNSKEIYKALKDGNLQKYRELIDTSFVKEIEDKALNIESKKDLENKNNANNNNSQYVLPKTTTENNTITLPNGTEIKISTEEYAILNINKINGKVGNQEALKNLINTKEKLSKLGLDFVWENRDSIFKIMKNNSEFRGKQINITDKNLIDKREFNNLLQFILKIYGDKNSSSVESHNYARILQINNIGAISDKKNTNSGLSNIGQRFVKIGFFNSSGGLEINGEHNLRQYTRNGYKLENKTKTV